MRGSRYASHDPAATLGRVPDSIESNPRPAGGIELAPGVIVPATAVRLGYARSGGPGGQNVNKVNTKVEMWVSLNALAGIGFAAIERLKSLAGRRVTQAGEIHLSVETGRSQEGNRQEAFQRLRELIVQARIAPKKRRKTKPSRAAKARRLDSKRHRGEIKAGRQGRHE